MIMGTDATSPSQSIHIQLRMKVYGPHTTFASGGEAGPTSAVLFG